MGKRVEQEKAMASPFMYCLVLKVIKGEVSLDEKRLDLVKTTPKTYVCTNQRTGSEETVRTQWIGMIETRYHNNVNNIACFYTYCKAENKLATMQLLKSRMAEHLAETRKNLEAAEKAMKALTF